jgi:hypothetical protein
MDNPKDIEQGVKQILRRLDKAIQRDNLEGESGSNQLDKPQIQSLPNDLREALEGVGWGFITLFICMLAIVVTGNDFKVMFGSFATICLLVCVYKLDKVSRPYQKSRKEDRAT